MIYTCPPTTIGQQKSNERTNETRAVKCLAAFRATEIVKTPVASELWLPRLFLFRLLSLDYKCGWHSLVK